MQVSQHWRAIGAHALADERTLVAMLSDTLADQLPECPSVSRQAAQWIEAARAARPLATTETLLRAFPLDTAAGHALMSLAEALLRIPDNATAGQLVRDLLAPIDWHQYQHAESRLVRLTGRSLAIAQRSNSREGAGWQALGEPIVRHTLVHGVRRMATQFVLGETLEQALRRARPQWQEGIVHSFDMLGEAAVTTDEANAFQAQYSGAIYELAAALDKLAATPDKPAAAYDKPAAALDKVVAGQAASTTAAATARSSISIKLSALHPRYEPTQWPRLQRELLPRLLSLVEQAAARDVAVTLDAEEADRFEPGLMLLERALALLPATARPYLGLALQAYSKRAWFALPWLRKLARQYGIRLPVRLVKGAYWDTEIKRAQQRGLADYPVFTNKRHTDIAYLACARWLLAHGDEFYPQFATHNAVTLAHLLHWAPSHHAFELQRLHGMGEPLFRAIRAQHPDVTVRVYAPVGAHDQLLPYLVRRLLENGANSAFVRWLHDPAIAAAQLAEHPLMTATAAPGQPSPRRIFEPARPGSPGLYLANEPERQQLLHELNAFRGDLHDATAGTAGAVEVTAPSDHALVGRWLPLNAEAIPALLATARAAQPAWAARPVSERAACLDQLAQLLEQHRVELVALMARETGKTIDNSLEEIREAADLCRYYGRQALQLMSTPTALPGPVGEQNLLSLQPRGVFVCISPWNFPVAIFTGQIVAALVTGNAVLAKPAEQATLTALAVQRLMLQAGIAPELIQLATGAGETIGNALVRSEAIAGVAFTGGWETAQHINRALASRDGPIVPLIAETGGINAMIADATVLPQQLVHDVLRSAFDSAGQRCSALRLLCVPTSIGARLEALLIGAMDELQLGDPLDLSSDIGPVIDDASQRQLLDYLAQQRRRGTLLHQAAAPAAGNFVGPALIRLNDLDELQREIFGPILHLHCYRETEQTLAWIRRSGYGLTCGVQSRNERWARALVAALPVGNCYINRDLIGAAVASQPFGGVGRSGTGFKAGGPNYLLRFATEQTVTINTAALGGDTALLGRAQP